jgi:hypothetical protein
MHVIFVHWLVFRSITCTRRDRRTENLTVVNFLFLSHKTMTHSTGGSVHTSEALHCIDTINYCTDIYKAEVWNGQVQWTTFRLTSLPLCGNKHFQTQDIILKIGFHKTAPKSPHTISFRALVSGERKICVKNTLFQHESRVHSYNTCQFTAFPYVMLHGRISVAVNIVNAAT